MPEKPEQFSPQALQIMENILKSDKPYEGGNLARFVRMDSEGEVVKIQDQKVVLTAKALRYIMLRIFGKAPLVSVDLAKNDEAGDSNREHQEPENLPESHEAK